MGYMEFLFFLVCVVCRNGGASSWELIEMVEGGRQELMARSARRNGTAVWGDESLPEKPTGAEEEKMRGQ
jgi:hypothetical protein